jgi:hypothetical protein
MLDLIEKALKAKHESKHVEFKEAFDPNSAQDWCEIIKDLVAVANSGGGIIIFGVDNHGKPSGYPTESIKNLDPADVANKVFKYTGAVDLEFEIRDIKKRKTNLVAFVIHAVSVPIVFLKPGTYDIGGGKQRTAFSVGTVYFRHGAKSEPGTSDDIRKVIERQLELIRKSWIKGVRNVVQSPPGSQVVTVLQRRSTTSTSPLSNTVHAVKDPNAKPILLTRDATKASGTFVYEEISEGIFDEINNVIDANTALAKGQQHFFLGQSIYFRIYAERQHVQQSDSTISLLLHSAVNELYAPSLYWIVRLPVEITASTFASLYLNPKSPHIHYMLRIAILLGKEFCEWLYGKWNYQWKRHPQPPSFYWAFKNMISKKIDQQSRRLIAARVSPSTQFTIAGTTSLPAKELIEKPEQAAILLSNACMQVFKGKSELRSISRNIDYLAYGGEVERRSAQISRAIIKEVGDRQSGDITEEKDED